MKTKQTGFTLVEIAIVLVIIGLLLGGILKGQEMITQAKIKNVVNDFNGITAAVNSYQDRYRALPGDDLSAQPARLGLGGFGGDGNGVFGTASPPLLYTIPPRLWFRRQPRGESQFWRHSGSLASSAARLQSSLLGFSSRPTRSTASWGCRPPAWVSLPTSSARATCRTRSPLRWTPRWTTAPHYGAKCADFCRPGPNPATGSAAPLSTYAETGTNQYLLCKNM